MQSDDEIVMAINASIMINMDKKELGVFGRYYWLERRLWQVIILECPVWLCLERAYLTRWENLKSNSNIYWTLTCGYRCEECVTRGNYLCI